MLTSPPPSSFGRDFLLWFQQQTEASWKDYPRPLKALSGFDWQAGTRWLGGLSDEEISALEQRWHVTFPSDYRLFLRILHTVDRPCLDIEYLNGKTTNPKTASSYFSWYDDPALIQQALDEPFQGLVGMVQRGTLWLPTWGERPTSPSEREEQFRVLFRQAPRLIPVDGHIYLMIEPLVAGNSLLSIVGDDIVILASNLRFFLILFSEIIVYRATQFDEDDEVWYPFPQSPSSQSEVQQLAQPLPFWRDFIY